MNRDLATSTHSHIKSVLTKLGVRSKLEAVLFGLREGLLQLSQPR
jgi:hypothetical protein